MLYQQHRVTGHLSVVVSQVLSPEEQTLAASNDYNFDHPGAFDFELLVATLRKLKQGKSVKIPVYDFTTHRRQKDWVSCVCITASSLVMNMDFLNCLKF